jgi:hypothetical protein
MSKLETHQQKKELKLILVAINMQETAILLTSLCLVIFLRYMKF